MSRDAARAAARREVLAVVQEMDRVGLTSGAAGNVSARAGADEVVLTPTAMAYPGMTEADLVVCDLEGRVLEGDRAPTTEIALHLACLRRHADIGAVVHTHAVHASMFAVLQQPIPCVLEEFEAAIGGDVLVTPAYHRTGSEALGEAVAPLVADRAAALVANHGLVVVAATASEALELSQLVERGARIVWGARAMGEPVPLPDGVRRGFAEDYRARRREAAARAPWAQPSSASSAARSVG